MTGKHPTQAAIDFCLEIGEAWGEGWMKAFAREIKAGTFTHVDDEPLMSRRPAPAFTTNEQLTLEGVSPNGKHRPTPLQR